MDREAVQKIVESAIAESAYSDWETVRDEATDRLLALSAPTGEDEGLVDELNAKADYTDKYYDNSSLGKLYRRAAARLATLSMEAGGLGALKDALQQASDDLFQCAEWLGEHNGFHGRRAEAWANRALDAIERIQAPPSSPGAVDRGGSSVDESAMRGTTASHPEGSEVAGEET